MPRQRVQQRWRQSTWVEVRRVPNRGDGGRGEWSRQTRQGGQPIEINHGDSRGSGTPVGHVEPRTVGRDGEVARVRPDEEGRQDGVAVGVNDRKAVVGWERGVEPGTRGVEQQFACFDVEGLEQDAGLSVCRRGGWEHRRSSETQRSEKDFHGGSSRTDRRVTRRTVASKRLPCRATTYYAGPCRSA